MTRARNREALSGVAVDRAVSLGRFHKAKHVI
jgi:hypothetical protein